MKKLFTLFAFLACFMGANAVEIVDAEVDFTTAESIKYYGWGRSDAAAERLSLDGENGLWYHSDEATGVNWDVQFFPIGGFIAEEGVTYTLHVTIKGSPAASIAAHMCGVDNYSAISFTEEWGDITVDYTAKSTSGDLLVQCGSFVGDYWIKKMKVTHDGREQKPVDWKNILTNGDAATAWEKPDLLKTDEGWEKVCAWSKEYKRRDAEEKELIHPCDIEDGVFVCKTDEVNPPIVFDVETELWGTTYAAGDPKPDNTWQNQFWIALPRPLKDGEPYKVSFKYKASENAHVTTQNHTTLGDYLDGGQVGALDFTTEWQTYTSKELSASKGMQSIAFNFGENKQYEKCYCVFRSIIHSAFAKTL